MGTGPLLVVGADGAQLDEWMGATSAMLSGWGVSRFDGAVNSLRPHHVYFLQLSPAQIFPAAGRDFTGATFVTIGPRDDLPVEAEAFLLPSGDNGALVPLLRALAHRRGGQCGDHRVHDEALAEVSRSLAMETADLERALEAIGSALACDRVTLFELRRDGLSADATHEWCAPRVGSLRARLPTLARRTLLWLLTQLGLQKLIRIDDMAALPFTAIEERVLAEVRQVQSMLVAPLLSPRGTFCGAIVAERIVLRARWTGQSERLLRMAGEMMASYLERRGARAEAREGETVHRQLLEHIQDGIFMAAANGAGFTFVSPPAARMWGMTVDELLAGADNWRRVVHPEDLPRVLARVRAARGAQRGDEGLEFRILRADDGCERWIRWRSFPVLGTGGEVEKMAGLLEDITEQREQQSRVRLLARVFETTGEAVVITAPDGSIIDINPAFTRITGYTRDEVLGKNPRIMSSGRHSREFYADMWHSLATRHYWHGEIWDRRKDGTEYPKLLTINAITEEDGGVSSYVGVFNDITDVKATEARLERMAHHDALTGLPNRLLFRDRLEQAVAQAVRGGWLLGVMFVDLDGFKEINDRLGHRAGDQLLMEVAQRLKEQVRESDTVARLGGDEFTAILPQIADREGAVAVAEKFLAVVASPFHIMGRTVRISASIGISLFPDHAGDVDGLVRSADGAMYRAKEAGRNQLCFAAAS